MGQTMPLSQSEKEANLNPLINDNNNNNGTGGGDDGGKIEDSKELDMKASTEVVKHDIVSSPEGQGRVDN